jgi:hypothetical protein
MIENSGSISGSGVRPMNTRPDTPKALHFDTSSSKAKTSGTARDMMAGERAIFAESGAALGWKQSPVAINNPLTGGTQKAELANHEEQRDGKVAQVTSLNGRPVSNMVATMPQGSATWTVLPELRAAANNETGDDTVTGEATDSLSRLDL